MNDFITNLLNRHDGLGELVEPRTRHRFEPENTTGFDPQINSSLNRVDSQIGRESDQNPVNTEATSSVPLTASDNKTIDKNFEQNSTFSIIQPVEAAAEVNINVNAEQPSTGKLYDQLEKSNVLETNGGRLSTVNDRQPGLTSSSDMVFNKTTSLSHDSDSTREHNREGDHNQDFYNNLKRLSQLFVQTRPEEKENSFRSDDKNRLTSQIREVPQSDQFKPGKQSVVEPVMPQVFQKDHDIRPGRQESLRETAASQAAPKRGADLMGLMETPAWLTDFKSEFSNRLKAQKTEIQPEPVINVSIGRVEVKAIQAQKQRQAKKKAKPTGVMSLDEYLKQRQQRG